MGADLQMKDVCDLLPCESCSKEKPTDRWTSDARENLQHWEIYQMRDGRMVKQGLQVYVCMVAQLLNKVETQKERGVPLNWW